MKTTISIEKDTFHNINQLRKDEAGCPITGWDDTINAMCEIIREHNGDFQTVLREESKMAKIKCQVCGQILGSMRELKTHFKHIHKTKEAMTIIE